MFWYLFFKYEKIKKEIIIIIEIINDLLFKLLIPFKECFIKQPFVIFEPKPIKNPDKIKPVIDK